MDAELKQVRQKIKDISDKNVYFELLNRLKCSDIEKQIFNEIHLKNRRFIDIACDLGFSEIQIKRINKKLLKAALKLIDTFMILFAFCFMLQFYCKNKKMKGGFFMAEFASKGLAGTALGLAIPGTVALVNQLMGNNGCDGNGGILNFNKNNGNCYVTEKEFAWAEKYNTQVSKTTALEAENFTRQAATKAFEDSVTYAATLNEKTNTNIKEIFGEVINIRERVAKLESGANCLNQKLDYEVAGVTKDYQSAIALESERRKCGDENLYSYVNGTFVPGNLIMPASKICPPVQLQNQPSTGVDIDVIVNTVLQILSKKQVA